MLYAHRRADLRLRAAAVDRAARDRAHGARQEVRREGDPVHGRLRPDAVVAQEGRHRVRPQGDPARRLHPDDRDGAAGRADGKRSRWPRRIATDDRGLPPGQPRRGQDRRGRAAAVLPAHARQEDDRHARWADDEPDHLPRPHRVLADRLRDAGVEPDHAGRAGRQVRGGRERDPTADQGLHADELAGGIGRATRRRPDRRRQRHEGHVVGPAHVADRTRRRARRCT